MKVVKVDDRFSRPRGGWCDICIYVVFDDPECCQVVGEIQIVHDELMRAGERLGSFDAYLANRFRAEVRRMRGKTDSAWIPWSVQAGEADSSNAESFLSPQDLLLSTKADEKARNADSLDLAMMDVSTDASKDALAQMESAVSDEEDREFAAQVDNVDFITEPYIFMTDPPDVSDSITLQIDYAVGASLGSPRAKYPVKFAL